MLVLKIKMANMHTIDCIFCLLSSSLYTECFAFSATDRHVWCFGECVAVFVSSTVEALDGSMTLLCGGQFPYV